MKTREEILNKHKWISARGFIESNGLSEPVEIYYNHAIVYIPTTGDILKIDSKIEQAIFHVESIEPAFVADFDNAAPWSKYLMVTRKGLFIYADDEKFHTAGESGVVFHFSNDRFKKSDAFIIEISDKANDSFREIHWVYGL